MALFKVTSESYVEAPTMEQAMSALVDQLTLTKEGEGFCDPQWEAWFGAGSHSVIPCEDDGTPRCPECDESSFYCPNCHTTILIEGLVDIFHVGKCERCGKIEEPCPGRTDPALLED